MNFSDRISILFDTYSVLNLLNIHPSLGNIFKVIVRVINWIFFKSMKIYLRLFVLVFFTLHYDFLWFIQKQLPLSFLSMLVGMWVSALGIRLGGTWMKNFSSVFSSVRFLYTFFAIAIANLRLDTFESFSSSFLGFLLFFGSLECF